MKLKYRFVIRDVAGKPVAVTIGADNAAFNGMVKLNDSAKFIFEKLNTEDVSMEALISAVMENYSIDEATAKEAVEAFVANLRANNLIEE